jgi:hypothetical protein
MLKCVLVASTRWPPAESHIVALLRIEAYKKYVGPTLPIPEPRFRRVPEAADCEAEDRTF